jgi:hypothetical protein
MSGGGTTVQAPQPSPEERALQKEQVELLREQRAMLSQQRAEFDLLAPTLFKEAGLKPTYDASGKLIGLEELTLDELSPEKREAREIETLFRQRSLAALKGELPVNPALLTQLEKEEMTLNETLRRNLGTGFETSTPGIEARGEFGRRRSDILEASRRGDLTLAEQLGQARETSVLNRPFAEVAGTSAATNRFANPFAAGSQLLQSFQGPLSNYAAQRQAELQARMGTAQSSSASSAGWGQLAGSLAMAGAYAY